MSKPQAPKTTPLNEPAVSIPNSGSNSAAAAIPAAVPPSQLSSFEAAMKLFHTRQLKDARELFVHAARGPERDVAIGPQLHIAMCDRRLQQVVVNLRSPEDYYNYGVALINLRNLAEARTHLERLSKCPRARTTCITPWPWPRRWPAIWPPRT